MSRKFKKQRKKQTASPVLWLVSGGVLLIALALVMVLFVSGNDSGGGTPALAVDQEVIQYGDVKFNVPLTFAIKVTNTGDGTLRFKEDPYIEVREGC
ncbi:MAG: hypothetical protein Kow002_14300 [Anaerolineales bacterium]